ncbi:hypothetical protein GQX74_013689 [Glossina fuscipes]|nr:hypothetical protein GQX74_013689 [Glossina fuscipes]
MKKYNTSPCGCDCFEIDNPQLLAALSAVPELFSIKLEHDLACMMCSRNIKISVALFLILVPIFTALPHSHNLSKRSNFFDLECKGIFNKTMFFRLDRICEDCYQLFRETSIHRLCNQSVNQSASQFIDQIQIGTHVLE